MTGTSELLSSPQACAPLPPRVRSLGTSFPLGDTEGEERHTQFHQDLILVFFFCLGEAVPERRLREG